MADWVMEEETKAQRGSAIGAGHTARKVQLWSPQGTCTASALSDPRCGRGQRLSSPSCCLGGGNCGHCSDCIGVGERKAATGGGGGRGEGS